MRSNAITGLLIGIALSCTACKPAEEVASEGRASPKTVPASAKSLSHVLTKAQGKIKGVVLLFHQAGSNLHEYDPIAPMFNKIGYDTIAVDQRSGGRMWGYDNVTAKKFSNDPGYSSAYADMEAALKIAEDKGYARIIVVGSSYSATLSLKLASERSTVSAVMAFSPGEYLDVKGEAAKWNSMVTVPTLFAGTKEEVINEMFTIYESAPRVEKRSGDVLTYFPGGVHGASTLRKDKNTESSDDYWAIVKTFLDSHFPD